MSPWWCCLDGQMIYNHPQRHTGAGTAVMIQRSSPHPVVLFSLRLLPTHLFFSFLSAVPHGPTSTFTGARLSSGKFHKACNEDIINHVVFFLVSTVVSLQIINTDIAQSWVREEENKGIKSKVFWAKHSLFFNVTSIISTWLLVSFSR